MTIDQILRLLEEAQASLAKNALQQPQDRDAFEYGRTVGMYAGLEHAKDVIVNMVADRERKEYDF
jgi:hypothetical protein|tara:strand:+ start:259 stop:453 length:195 start_codon:yes stop_codon:yes gene_type:complete